MSAWGCVILTEVAFLFYYLPVKIGQICCPETSVRNYHYLVRNKAELLNSVDLRSLWFS